MDHFNHRNGQLYAENLAVTDIAKHWGTPCYIYSRAALTEHWQNFDQAFGNHPHRICYAVKANGNLALLNLLAKLGSGFDIVSEGELERVLAAGGAPSQIVFSGVGKRHAEIKRALMAGIGCLHIESPEELERINAIAKELNLKAPISVRVNPDVDAKTHPYISTGLKENKFGIALEDALAVYQQAAEMSHIDIQGVACHIGSQLTTLEPFLAALQNILSLIDALSDHSILIKKLSMGGGLGVRYHEETPPNPKDYISALLKALGNRKIEMILEPGRAIVATAGILITRVEYLKTNADKNFAVVDAAMNDLIRPALYSAWQTIEPVIQSNNRPPQNYDVVGPVCETADFLGKDRSLTLQTGDLLAIRDAGAYGFVMSSNYNARPRVAEVMVDGDKSYLVRKRETIESLFENESLLPD